MKLLGTTGLVLLAQLSFGQLMLRNDFTIGRDFRIRNKGLSIVAFAFDRQGNMNLMGTSRSGRALVIDVNALRHPRQQYTYQELATRIYSPVSVYRPGAEQFVPAHLLMEPPNLRRPGFYSYRRTTALR